MFQFTLMIILITGKSRKAHLENLEAVLSRLEDAGMHLKRSKCSFMQKSLEYLGHVISEKGLQLSPKKIAAYRHECLSFLGLVNYYCKFLPNMESMLAPLYELLQKNCKMLSVFFKGLLGGICPPPPPPPEKVLSSIFVLI